MEARCSVRLAASALRSNEDENKEGEEAVSSMAARLVVVSGVETNAAPKRSPDIDSLTEPTDKLPSP